MLVFKTGCFLSTCTPFSPLNEVWREGGGGLVLSVPMQPCLPSE